MQIIRTERNKKHAYNTKKHYVVQNAYRNIEHVMKFENKYLPLKCSKSQREFQLATSFGHSGMAVITLSKIIIVEDCPEN